MVKYLSTSEEVAMITAFEEGLQAHVFIDDEGYHHPLFCCVCDTSPKAGTEFNWIYIDTMEKYAQDTRMHRSILANVYPMMLLNQYKVSHCLLLEPYVLSPNSIMNKADETIAICLHCNNHFESLGKLRRQDRRHPPPRAIVMGYMVGEAPELLKSLNEVELALLSTVRTTCQTWIFFGGAHRQIQGWHTFYENSPGSIIGHVQNLASAGVAGHLLFVLCGPFTSDQKALLRKQTFVNVEKLIEAFTWLKCNNFIYADIEIPEIDQIPQPQIISEN